MPTMTWATVASVGRPPSIGDVLADAVQLARAARAELVPSVDHHLHAGQVRRQGATVGAALPGLFRAGRRVGLLGLGGDRRFGLLHVLQPELQLVQRQGLPPGGRSGGAAVP